jgi:hypothetical protein
VFTDAVSNYAEPLGSAGRARLRALIDEAAGLITELSTYHSHR